MKRLVLLLLAAAPLSRCVTLHAARLAPAQCIARAPSATCAAKGAQRWSGDSAPDGGSLISAISADGSISAKAVITTGLVTEAQRLQGLGGLACAAVGRALTCSILVAEGVKEDETFQIKFDGDGPLRGVFATCNGKLESRGYVGNPAVTLPTNSAGKLDVGGGVGKGTLQVVRTKNLPGEETATQYSSITEIRSGEIPEDINYYLLESEQRQGALAAGVFVQSDTNTGSLDVVAAGGWYVQLLPFAADESVAQLEENLKALASRSPTTLLREGLDARGIVGELLKGMEPQFNELRRVPGVVESCPCSEERVLRTLRLIPRDELEEIMEQNEVIEAKCEFCNKVFSKTPAEIKDELELRK